ncbi:MAG: hypothetical protein K0S68_477, partial [Candidatus Saccharibacteria bacterium]|nr:hypothetical protein [Candidatus Saccharibacteria bacterium]
NLKIVEPEGGEGQVEGAVAAEKKDDVKSPDSDAEAEMVARTKREFADLDDLDL